MLPAWPKRGLDEGLKCCGTPRRLRRNVPDKPYETFPRLKGAVSAALFHVSIMDTVE